MGIAEEMTAFRAAVDAAVFTLGIQPDAKALRECWNGLLPSVKADARVIRAKDARKAELGVA
jgi:hypothetical protein